jgi:hypothetical protein
MQSYNPLAAIQGGYGFGAQIDEDKARRQAGNALAGNDFTGARNALSQAGMLGEAMDIQGYQDQRSAYDRNVARQDTQDRYAAEDRTLDNADREKAARAAEIRERGQWLGNATSSLMRVPPEQRQQAFEQYILPTLQAMGADAQTIQRLTTADKSDAALQAYLGTLGQQIAEAEGVVLSEGAQLRNKRTGELMGENPRAPEYIQRDPEKQLFEVGGPSGPNAGPEVTSEAIAAAVTQAVPGARMTSGPRSAADNARVGGVPNSYHMTGQAGDFVPPQGVPMGQFAQQVQAAVGPQFEVINEGDHVHVEPRSRPQSGGPRLISDAQPKPREGYRPATAEEKAAYGLPANAAAQIGPNGQIQTIGPNGGAGRPVPPAVISGLQENRNLLSKLDRTLAALDDRPESVGLQNFLPDTIIQRTDRDGVTLRALIADLSSAKIHERSGAAVSAAEFPRLRPFIPLTTDTPNTIRQKLANFKAEMEAIIADTEVSFGEGSGYAPISTPAPAAPAASASAPAPARPATSAPGRSGARRPLGEIIR